MENTKFLTDFRNIDSQFNKIDSQDMFCESILLFKTQFPYLNKTYICM